MCQPKFLPEPPKSSDNGIEGSKKRKAPSTSSNRTRVLSLNELQENFHLPINEVACKLGVCVTVLKQQCRELGIVRWPYRKVRKLDNMLTALESAGPSKARPFALTNGEEERQRKICTVKHTLQQLISDPNSCAHLKLGKVKSTSVCAPAATSTSPQCSVFQDKGLLERLGVSSQESLKEERGSDSSDQAVFEAAQALVRGPQGLPHSGSSGSRVLSSTQDSDLLHNADVPTLKLERELKAGSAEASMGDLGLSRGNSSHASLSFGAWGLGLKKDLKACWMQSFCSGIAGLPGSVSLEDIVPPLQGSQTRLHLAPGAAEHSAFVPTSISESSPNISMNADAIVDSDDSVHGGHARSGTVELDLISRLDSPKPTPAAAAEPTSLVVQHEGLASEDAKGIDPSAEDASATPPECGISSSSAVVNAMAVLPVPTGLPAIGIPVPYPCVGPCVSPSRTAAGASMTVSEMYNFQQQQLIMHQHQLLGFFRHPPAHQIMPGMFNSAVASMNVQRHAIMANHFAQLNSTRGHLQSPRNMGSVLTSEEASY